MESSVANHHVVYNFSFADTKMSLLGAVEDIGPEEQTASQYSHSAVTIL